MTKGKNVDKSGQKKGRTGFDSGKRLKLARDIKMLRNIDMANAFENLTEEGLKGWYKRGISKNRVVAVAEFFGVEEWVFSDDYSISKEEFKKLFRSGSPEAPPPSRKSRLALFPVQSFLQGISQNLSDPMSIKNDISGGEKETTQDLPLLLENWKVPWDWDEFVSNAHDDGDYHFRVGSKCNEDREYDQAIFNFDKAIWMNTLNTDSLCQAYYERGYSYYEKGVLKDAWQDYLKSLHTDLDGPFQDLRFPWYNRNHQSDRIKEFTLLAKEFPDRAVIYYFRGIEALDMKDYDSAVADFTDAIELEPESGNIDDFYAVRGYAFYQKRLYPEAIDEFTHLIEKGIILSPQILYLGSELTKPTLR